MEPAVEQDLMEFSNMMKDLLAFPRQDLDVLEGCASHQVVKENSSQEGDQDKFVGDYPKQLAKALRPPQPSPNCQENAENATDMEEMAAQGDKQLHQQLKVRPNPPSGPTIHIPLGVHGATGAAPSLGRGRGKRGQPSSSANERASSGQGKVSYGACGHLIRVRTSY